jgi:multidrug efflux pump subunit AcrA (membrane-fusion protein)
VNPLEDKKVCYVVNGSKLEQREVEAGEFNDEFIEIKNGLQEGDRVCLRTPVGVEENGAGEGKKKASPGKEEPKPQDKGASTATKSGT